MSYKDKYSGRFYDDLERISFSNPKLKSIISKAIASILENPYVGTSYIAEFGCRRKHIGAKKYRIFYNISENPKKVTFYSLRPKDKSTYKGNIF